MRTNKKQTIYWTKLVYGEWSLYLAATEKGLCYVGSLHKPFEELDQWSSKHFPGSTLVEDAAALKPYTAEIIEYMQAKRQQFTIPFDYQGTSFQLAVWDALCQIPYGETKSYSEIAHQIQKPAAVRAVGTAIGANPVLITVPCHRVIGKNGALTGYRGGLEMKSRLLELEGAGKQSRGSMQHA
ncbi:methylated-DNA--protein-cysteine methyltransferase, inducible [Brevibacillus reuszeri]|uniref:methylated-DNA--[protein]-cysteine S-methyltransferase n=1 Tax=Brevibacillus reuszeri TaxID=54915 RepID=A0A0K9YIT8_9BACL|nr:methylated-DNA--[protein]-cysteine S-methyltransferase [Brevibacillus reuszeri]KNB68586.1 cysteine methyltransferase [Brevibacillus reuszeri]MED1858869.1 methylated-DNA--[protein]-cysteine S-methyltransferase [Brevibacillus reuszeri]GED69083.1 methylated-DNA--protein-cysteine methyltransferase, inducible [Brevibacillus reuszeri]